MRIRKPIPRPTLMIAATVFCAVVTLYAGTWMYEIRRTVQHQVELGFNTDRATMFDAATSCIPVYNVAPGSPAEKAGLRPGDDIYAINGVVLTSGELFDHVWSTAVPGDKVQLTVTRAGESQPVVLHGVFRRSSEDRSGEGIARTSARQATSFFPVFFLLVGFTVLFLRLEDPYAWLVAVLFTCIICEPAFHDANSYTRTVWATLMAFRGAGRAMLAAVFYAFFAVFPEKSPLEKRVPSLKWVALGLGLSQLFAAHADGDPRWMTHGPLAGIAAETLRRFLVYTFIVLGMASLLGNAISRETSVEGRRKSRVMLWGTALGILPAIVRGLASDMAGWKAPFWVDTGITLLILLYPLSFAYAIVKHRVLEIPALFRRSVRYVLVQRGFNTLLIAGALGAIFLFTRFFSSLFAGHSQAGMALSGVFGVALVWMSGPLVRRGTQRIDRAFFRSSYDAQQILQALAEKTPAVTNRDSLAALLDQQIQKALHPKTLAIYFERTGGVLAAAGGDSTLPVLRAEDAWLAEVAKSGSAWDVPLAGSAEAPKEFPLAGQAPECLVPLVGREARLVGLLVLGERRSEEPYSREDKRLLESVAGQTATALENIRLAENIADRIEAERRAAHEIDIARDVQSRLFPQVMPKMATLEYTGNCRQARQVGGDYYDFLDLGGSQLALILADISGKGIAGALLMANLQANLRSRFAAANYDLPRLLQSVNRLFYENSPDDRYATMFLGVYHDDTRELEYANCGHNPPLVVRADGQLERLTPTAAVIGLFAEWECETRRIALGPGDLLVVYTDGVTEANDARGEEFGEERLVDVVKANRVAGPDGLLRKIQETVMTHSAGEQADDLTLVIGAVR